jgi:hypothetical protein
MVYVQGSFLGDVFRQRSIELFLGNIFLIREFWFNFTRREKCFVVIALFFLNKE